MDNLQKLRPDLKEIYEKVMNTPTQPLSSPQQSNDQTTKPGNGMQNGSINNSASNSGLHESSSVTPLASNTAPTPTQNTQPSSSQTTTPFSKPSGIFGEIIKKTESPLNGTTKPVEPVIKQQFGIPEEKTAFPSSNGINKSLPVMEKPEQKESLNQFGLPKSEPSLSFPKNETQKTESFSAFSKPLPPSMPTSPEPEIIKPTPDEGKSFSSFSNAKYTKTEEKTTTLSTPPPPTPRADILQKPAIPNPIVQNSKSKVGAVARIVEVIFFIFYTLFWLTYFEIINKSMLGL